MKVQDLLEAITEGDTPESFELKDIVTNFPTKYDKMIKALWGKDQLTYKGKKLFADGLLGPVYEGAIKAAEKELGRMTIEFELPDPEDGGDSFMSIDNMRFEEDAQEVYLGYDPKQDQLFIGFDAWLSEDLYNDATQKFDDSDPEVEKGLNAAWKFFSDHRFYGVLLDLDTSDGVRFRASENQDVGSQPGGFYKAVYKKIKTDMKLVDLRLD